MEHGEKDRQRLMDLYPPPGYGNEFGQLVVHDPIFDDAHLMGLYDLASLCQLYGRYYYVAEERYYYYWELALRNCLINRNKPYSMA